ncbi:hypothetical protein [Nocardioides mangrovicus]|uniref:hypothetical protein n=1 Tax=Nocardioides mangrovicus TaxID=2478913 RepID=UPI0011C407FA|nr:hypothetical protein [Nocardioides mangrovicus]
MHTGPFTRSRALELGVSRHMFEGQRFVRIHPKVWRLNAYEMTDADWILAAALGLPDDARLTGMTRIQQLGLDAGPHFPLRFVLARDHHQRLDGVFLHRTKQLAPHDAYAVEPAGAFIAYCATARTIEAIGVGDWLLHHGHLTLGQLRELALRDLWRLGAQEALWISHHLDGLSRSLPESQLRAMITFSGLPAPIVNQPVRGAVQRVALADLEIRPPGLAIEYEGEQHQVDRDQYLADLDRYADLRRADQPYLQVTKELLRRPRQLLGRIHRELVRLGYAGPAPDLATDRWHQLICPLRAAVGDRGRRTVDVNER